MNDTLYKIARNTLNKVPSLLDSEVIEEHVMDALEVIDKENICEADFDDIEAVTRALCKYFRVHYYS